MRRVDEMTEKRSRRQTRLHQAWALVASYGTPPQVPDFSRCSTEGEMRFAALGGDPEIWRALAEGEDEQKADATLHSLAASFGRELPSEPGGKTTPVSEGSGGMDERHAVALRKLGLDPDLAKCRNEDDLRNLQAQRAKVSR